MSRILLLFVFILPARFISAQNMEVIHNLAIHCDAWNTGDYYGEVTENMPNGYGLLRFPDSSFYSGQFENGKVTGLGFLRKAFQHKIIVGRWVEGQLINDWFTVFDNSSTLYLKRAINGKYFGRGTATYDGSQLQYVEAQDTSSASPQQYIFTLDNRDGAIWYVRDYDADGNSNSDMHSITSWEDEWKTYHMSHGKILSTERGRSLVYLEKIKSLWDEFEPGLPSLLKGLEHVKILRKDGFGTYFGRAFDPTPENGSLGFEFNTHANHILVSRYKNDRPASFIREMINFEGNQRYYFGNYDLTYDNGEFHTGEGIYVVFGGNKSLTITVGNLTRDGEKQDWKNYMSYQSRSDTSITVRFTGEDGDRKYGFIVLPNERYIYRGEMDDTGLPDGMGTTMAEETRIQRTGKYKHNALETVMPIPPMKTLRLTTLFDKPFDLSLE